MTTTLIYLIASHVGPGAHFSEFAKELRKEGCRVEILATGPALDILRPLGAMEFNPERLDIDDPLSQKLLAKKIVSNLVPSSVVITEVHHLLMASVHQRIALESPTIHRFSYYDNPEPSVPGSYMKVAAKVMACSEKVLFANANLAKEPLYLSPTSPIPLPMEKRIGIGYYPLQAAKFLECARAARREIARRLFFEANNLVDMGQKILVYLGGNNEVYFEKAFPAFLNFLRDSKLDPSQHIVLMQHHPGDKKREINPILSGGYPIFVSKTTSEEALVLADVVLYYQTSMGPQCVLAGIPAIQVGHETYFDILVRNHLAPSVTNNEEFLEAVAACRKPKKRATILTELGISKEWLSRLKSAVALYW